MALKQITVLVDGVDTTFSNEDVRRGHQALRAQEDRLAQNDNLFNLLLGILGAASPALQDASAQTTS
jgi:hypothetical protein